MKKDNNKQTDTIIDEQDLKALFAFEPEEEKEAPEETEKKAETEINSSEETAAEDDTVPPVPAETAADTAAGSSEEEAPAEPAEEGQPEPEEKQDKTAQAIDALDRDLERAVQRREHKKQEEEEKKRLEREKEAEFIEKMNKEREADALRKEREKALEKKNREEADAPPEVKKAETEDNEKKKKNVRIREKNTALGINLIRGCAAVVILAIAAYCGGLLYVKNINDEYIKSMERDLMGISAAGEWEESGAYTNTRDKLSAEEKGALSLSQFLPDSDKDGLSDHYEINVSKTDPLKSDSDGDGIPDGAEIYAGLDPLTANDDSEIITVEINAEGASAVIEGKPKNASAVIDRVTNNSITGAPGIIGNVYEFYTASAMQECTLTIEYTDEMLGKENASPDSISMFRFDGKELTFVPLESSVDTERHTVSAKIDSIGIYTIGVSEDLSEKRSNKIFFLIDNSGSMYPDELCPGSEENDTGFKRVEFANAVIDRLGDSAEYGAAMFTGTYKKLSSVTSDREAVKTQIDSMRTSENIFDGTDIEGAIIAAADELENSKDSRNYIIMLTDGYPTKTSKETENAALEKAAENGITVFTIGLGKRIDSDYLQNISDTTNGQYYQVSNADSLDRICGKIESFMGFNKTAVSLLEAEDSTNAYIIADSGFNVDRDSLSYSNFRTEFSESGTDYGIAELTRRYFTGELKMTELGYTTDSGEEIPGYNLERIEQLKDGKPNLVDLKIDFLDRYNGYLETENKWNYHTSKTGLLKYNESTMDYIINNNMSVSVLPYSVQLPELDDRIELLQKITFQRLPEFTSYECAVINSTLEGNDKSMFDAFRYMENIRNCSEKVKSYDFGYDGEEAYNVLCSELSRGDPVLMSAGGAALNGVRLLRESENSNKFILESYDCNKRGVTTYVSILRTPIYDGGKEPYYQYSAEVYGREVPLIMYVCK